MQRSRRGIPRIWCCRHRHDTLDLRCVLSRVNDPGGAKPRTDHPPQLLAVTAEFAIEPLPESASVAPLIVVPHTIPYERVRYWDAPAPAPIRSVAGRPHQLWCRHLRGTPRTLAQAWWRGRAHQSRPALSEPVHRCDAPYDFDRSGFPFGETVELLADQRHTLAAKQFGIATKDLFN
jgi:hypothetical protein